MPRVLNMVLGDELPGFEATLDRPDGGTLGFTEGQIDVVKMRVFLKSSGVEVLSKTLDPADWSVAVDGLSMTAVGSLTVAESAQITQTGEHRIRFQVVLDDERDVHFPNDAEGITLLVHAP